MDLIPPRAQYLSDGTVLWSRLPLAVAVALAAAAVVGWLFQVAYAAGFYLFMVLPVLGGCAIVAVLGMMLGWTRCRNACVAGGLGVLAGLATYACYYEVCMLKALPPKAGWRFDLLPRYVRHRLETDIVFSTHEVQRAKAPDLYLNCALSGFDLLLLLGVTGSGAWKRARRAYCPQLDQWMRRETTRWPAHSGPQFVAALQAGKLLEFVARTPAGGNPRVCCRLTVEYAVPDERSPLEYPAYATLTDAPEKAAWYRPDWIPATLLCQVALRPAEVLALRSLFAELAKLLAAGHPELADVPAEVTPGGDAAPAGEVAQISGIPAPPESRARKPAGIAPLVFLRLAPLLSALAGAVIFGGGCWLAVATPFWQVFFVTAPLATGLLIFALYAGMFCKGVLEGRWRVRRLREAIAERTDALVDAADGQAVCVSLIPRASFDAFWAETAADVMLLKIDSSGGRLLMEGRENRYCIPAGAICECQTQCFYHKLDQHNASQRWMLRLVVSSPQGSRELLLRVDPVRWVPSTNGRRRRSAEDMSRRIDALRSAGGREERGP